MEDSLKDSIKDSLNDSLTMTTNIKDYKTLFKQKVKYIKQNRTLLEPADDNLVNIIQNKYLDNLDNLDTIRSKIRSTIMASISIPGGTIGYHPMIPYTDTSKKICFQLEQGNIGWYWLYGTFPNKDCFLYQLTRVDLLPTDLRERLGYKLGETTVYCVTLGIGNGTDYYYGNVYFEGIFTIYNNVKFSIVSKDNQFVFSHDYNDMSIQCNMLLTNNKTNEQVKYNFSSQTKNNNIMSFNQLNGCYPCELNNSYQSYTNLYMNMNYSNEKGEKKSVENGFGWMDHEWGGSETPNVLYKSILSILRNGKVYTGLPCYIWLNIRLSDNTQYMIFNLFKSPPKKGDSVSCNINTYQSTVKFFTDQSSINVIIKDSIIFENTEYPVKYEIKIGNHTYLLDSTPFGNTIFRDFANTWHWGGSCYVYENAKIVGTGFLEAQRFDGDIKCLNDNFESIGFTSAENIGSIYYNTTNKSQLVFSYIIILFMIAFTFFVFYKVIEDVKDVYKDVYKDGKMFAFLYSFFIITIFYMCVSIQPLA
jgi:hypothetical protein